MTYSITNAQNVFSIKGNKAYMNGRLFQAIGLRFSNALLSDSTTNELIAHIDEYMEYGVNSISVYFMGSRYSDINGYNIDEMICKGKAIAPDICIAYNGLGYPPPCADLSIHFANKTLQLPYIETEGTPGLYWSAYSKEKGLGQYINVGIYTAGKRAEQLAKTKELLDAGYGYFFASTWLQNVPPNYHVGGDGTACNPGIKWWLSFIKDNYKNR